MTDAFLNNGHFPNVHDETTRSAVVRHLKDVLLLRGKLKGKVS